MCPQGPQICVVWARLPLLSPHWPPHTPLHPQAWQTPHTGPLIAAPAVWVLSPQIAFRVLSCLKCYLFSKHPTQSFSVISLFEFPAEQ